MIRCIHPLAVLFVAGCTCAPRDNPTTETPFRGRVNILEDRYDTCREHRPDRRARIEPVEARIESPANGSALPPAEFYEVKGTIASQRGLDGRTLLVFVQDHPYGNFYLSWPPVELNRRNGAWSASNVRLATPGTWRIHLATVTPSAERAIRGRVRNRSFGAMPALPPGSAVHTSIRVVRR